MVFFGDKNFNRRDNMKNNFMNTDSGKHSRFNALTRSLSYGIIGLLVILIIAGLPQFGILLTVLRLLVLGITLLVIGGLFVLVREIFGN